jgi:hypothetical protein
MSTDELLSSACQNCGSVVHLVFLRIFELSRSFGHGRLSQFSKKSRK